jgi:RNA-directed DNA polymerase
MKRSNHLIEQILKRDNLYLAFWKARKGKNAFDYVEDYRNDLENNINELQIQIADAKVCVGNYNYFKVYDPKERLICAAHFKERVLHHALMNVCHGTFEKYQIFDSYASRKGKGQYAALDRAMHYQKKYKWFLKLDVRKYFDSIDHDCLMGLLGRKFKEPKLLSIFEQILNSYCTAAGKGLPIGNLTSQYFANHYLAYSDHYIRDILKAQGYVRYMDDMVIWDNDKAALLDKGNSLQFFINQHLKLELKPFCLNKTTFGLPFLGYVVYQHKLHLNRTSKKRFRQKVHQYQDYFDTEEWTEKEYQKRILPLLAFAQKADSKNFRAICIKK